MALDPLIKLVTVRQGGQEGFANHIVKDLLERYLYIEELFQTKSGLTTEQDIIYSLRQVSETLVCHVAALPRVSGS